MRAGDLAPDDADLGAADLLLATVDVGNALAVVEGGSLGVVDALDLDERGVLPQGVLGALERDVLAPVVREEPPVSICLLSFFYSPCAFPFPSIHACRPVAYVGDSRFRDLVCIPPRVGGFCSVRTYLT